MSIENKKKYLIVILVAASLLIGALLVRQTIGFYHGIRQVHIPSSEKRSDRRPGIHSWMNTSEIAKNLGITEAEVFTALEITPQPGDEKLSLRALRDKYNIPQNEMQKRMQRLVVSHPSRSGP